MKHIPDSPGDSWYTDVPVFHNTLGKFLKEISKESGINTVNRSNHSLRTTAISGMYENQVPHKLIVERSGHLSVSVLLPYEHATVTQKKAVCDALLGKPMVEVSNKEKKPDGESIATHERKNIALESSTSDDITRSVESNTSTDGARVKEETSKALSKEGMADVMRNMQFSSMTDCAFNFTIR